MFSVHNAFGKNTGASGFELPAVEASSPLEMQTSDQSDIEKAFARTFSTSDGQIVLSHLQSMTFQRALGPDAPETQLRYLEGQRAMIATIMRLIRSGRSNGRNVPH